MRSDRFELLLSGAVLGNLILESWGNRWLDVCTITIVPDSDHPCIYVLSIRQCLYIYSPTSTYGHLSTTVTFFVPTDSPYIHSCLNLSTTVTSLQRPRPLKRGRTTKKTPRLLMKKSKWEWSWKLILMACWWLIVALVFWLCYIYTAAVSINCLRYLSRILWTLFALSRSNLIQNIVQVFGVFYLYIYYIWLNYYYWIQ